MVILVLARNMTNDTARTTTANNAGDGLPLSVAIKVVVLTTDCRIEDVDLAIVFREPGLDRRPQSSSVGSFSRPRSVPFVSGQSLQHIGGAGRSRSETDRLGQTGSGLAK